MISVPTGVRVWLATEHTRTPVGIGIIVEFPGRA
jgi:hypothetical protein